MLAGYTQSVPPATEPITLTEAKAQLRLDTSDEDTFVSSLIAAARELVESDTWRQLVTATWIQYRQKFPAGLRPIELDHPPLQTVSSITYYDTAGDEQTLSSATYHVDGTRAPGAIHLVNGNSWPATEPGRPNAVAVTYVAGYGAASAVPDRAKHAIKLLLGHWFNNRESVLIGTISKEVELAYERLVASLKYTSHLRVEE
jgi:uncharacterized phiE125 gp8 family phage protein